MSQLAERFRALIGRGPKQNKHVISTHSERKVVVCSILAILLLGLPLWWTTTRVYRADLPTADINRYSPNDAFGVPFSFYIDHDPRLPHSAIASIEKQAESLIEKEREPYRAGEWRVRYSATVRQGKAPDVPGHYTLRVRTGAAPGIEVDTGRSLTVSLPKKKQHIERDLARVISAIVAKEERTVRNSHMLGQKTTSRATAESTKPQTALKYSPEFSITMTLLNEHPIGGASVDWDIEGSVSAFMQSFVDALRPLTKLTVTSQVLHHAGPPPVTPLVHDNKTYLTPDMLAHFVNSPSWNLASVDPTSPMINFILYVPTLSTQPVHILESQTKGSKALGTDAFSISQWGGIAIANLPVGTKPGAKVVLSPDQMQKYMGIFIAQLRALIGIRNDTPLEPRKLNKKQADDPLQHITVRQAVDTGVSDWELDALMRQWMLYTRQTAITTLQSLVRLTDSLQNMVVMDEIKTQVDSSLLALTRIEQSLNPEHPADNSQLSNHLKAFSLAAMASVKAEGAFFDPSMVSMLYFPDQHKYAIYLPFFLPVAIPLLSAVKKIFAESKRKPASATSTKKSS
ncbi:GPI transamidase component [Coemansia spiralis]|uniref:GPI transamidase component n=2 Tax=Coemansia TaxID=4863 RepID=A0A9W8FWY3_9FUNG|nr:phosphatidylinositol-glycan biosynthesis class S protein [Coemansia spiralis]KAJ1987500.1 GPI transamidase component [Coemansia umbellata]KAJ2618613.1 GPI transamidase component [Coemansia sp. RSA 1358]KAJ2668564.1 GPI transamidase component [Coemansia spiralis]